MTLDDANDIMHDGTNYPECTRHGASLSATMRGIRGMCHRCRRRSRGFEHSWSVRGGRPRGNGGDLFASFHPRVGFREWAARRCDGRCTKWPCADADLHKLAYREI